LLPDLLVDTSARERGDPGRLLRAACDGQLERAVFLDGPTVWIDDPARESARVAGSGKAIVFDLGAARRSRATWQSGRLSLLGNGDHWSEREGAAGAEGQAAVRLDADPNLDRLRLSLEKASGR